MEKATKLKKVQKRCGVWGFNDVSLLWHLICAYVGLCCVLFVCSTIAGRPYLFHRAKDQHTFGTPSPIGTGGSYYHNIPPYSATLRSLPPYYTTLRLWHPAMTSYLLSLRLGSVARKSTRLLAARVAPQFNIPDNPIRKCLEFAKQEEAEINQ